MDDDAVAVAEDEQRTRTAKACIDDTNCKATQECVAAKCKTLTSCGASGSCAAGYSCRANATGSSGKCHKSAPTADAAAPGLPRDVYIPVGASCTYQRTVISPPVGPYAMTGDTAFVPFNPAYCSESVVPITGGAWGDGSTFGKAARILVRDLPTGEVAVDLGLVENAGTPWPPGSANMSAATLHALLATQGVTYSLPSSLNTTTRVFGPAAFQFGADRHRLHEWMEWESSVRATGTGYVLSYSATHYTGRATYPAEGPCPGNGTRLACEITIATP